jgi:outer membrane protein TolC
MSSEVYRAVARLAGKRGLAVILMVCGAGVSRADELDELVKFATLHSPVIQAAREETLQAEAARDATGEFFDPVSTVAAGRLSGSAVTPLVAAPAGLPAADAYGSAASVEVPLRPGVYAGAGVSEQYLVNPADGIAPGYRTLVGAQLRIPLIQDRGFSVWRQKQARMQDLRAAAVARQREACQAVRHAVELAYITYLVELANAATAQLAGARAGELLKEAEELVRLKVVPEYQLAPARLELALRREEGRASAQAIEVARVRLLQVIGSTPPAPLTTNAEALVARTAGLLLPAAALTAQTFEARGAMSEIGALTKAAAAESRLLEDRLRADLSLSVRGVWAAEDSTTETTPGLLSGDRASAAAVLVWTRPWSQTGDRARLRESRAREAQLAETHRELLNRLNADLAAASHEFDGARERLKEITMAVEQARLTLGSESERFRLGEGRSRNVLDAQNDLTKAYRTRNAVVGALLKGHSDFMYASGYGLGGNPAGGIHAPGGGTDGHQ